MDWETRRLTEMTDEELLEIALSEAKRVVSRAANQTGFGSHCYYHLLSTYCSYRHGSRISLHQSANSVLVQRWR